MTEKDLKQIILWCDDFPDQSQCDFFASFIKRLCPLPFEFLQTEARN